MSAPEPREDDALDLMDDRGRAIASLKIVAQETSDRQPYVLQRISVDEAREWGEERLQLLEGRTYEYQLNGHPLGSRLREGVFRRSRLSDNQVERGTLKPGTNTGLLPVVLERADGTPIAQAAVEVRSSKLEYRQHYREMLNYIADRSVDLLLNIRAQAMLRLSPEPAHDSKSLVQQFSFIQSILASRDFQNALQHILVHPHRLTEYDEKERDVRRGFPPRSNVVRQLAMRQPRTPLPPKHPLYARLGSLPTRLILPCRRETVDTAENRFVKHVLSQFAMFLNNMGRQITSRRNLGNERLRDQITRLQDRLLQVLRNSLFTDVSELKQLPLGSPVLQRRSGYREVLRAWLLFNLAASLQWNGGNDVYEGGKRDVAILYEYWLFFRLLDLFSSKFRFEHDALKGLVEKTVDGFGLKLKTGNHLPIEGSYEGYGRRLNVRFSFNRTFIRNGAKNEEVNYPVSGSWTRRMRPDYTLSLWPDGFTDEEAEQSELMVHLHFDAKYRVERLVEFFGEDTDADVEDARQAYREGRAAKRDDLLKMHAYRDAIRRSVGAYVLYPGTETFRWRGYHELLPNLGAFAVRPGIEEGMSHLSNFLNDVIEHLCNRATLRERLGYHIYAIQRRHPTLSVHTILPERGQDSARAVPPAEQYVLAAYCGEKGLPVVGEVFYLRLPEGHSLDQQLTCVGYVLLYSNGLTATPGLRRVGSPRLLSAKAVNSALAASGYTDIVEEGLYAAYDLKEIILPEKKWSADELAHFYFTDQPSAPVYLPLAFIVGKESTA